MTVSEYAKQHGLSEETVRRYIRCGKVSAIKEGRSYSIIENTTTHNANTTEILQQLLENKDVQIEQLQARVDHLKQLLSEKDGLIGQLHSESEHIQMTLDEVIQEGRESRERSDTIIMQLTKQLENQTLMLEDLRNHSLWRRIKMVFAPSGG